MVCLRQAADSLWLNMSDARAAQRTRTQPVKCPFAALGYYLKAGLSLRLLFHIDLGHQGFACLKQLSMEAKPFQWHSLSLALTMYLHESQCVLTSSADDAARVVLKGYTSCHPQAE